MVEKKVLEIVVERVVFMKTMDGRKTRAKGGGGIPFSRIHPSILSAL